MIADPFVDGGVELDSSSAFLVLMSDGLYQALTDATGRETINGDIASMVAHEFGQQTTLNGVAQAVVDRVVRIHHDTFMTGSDAKKTLCKKRDDITLLVRNFNYPLSVQSPGSVRSINSPSQPPQHVGAGFPSSIYNHQSPLPSSVSSPASDASRHQRSSDSESPKTPTNYLLTGPNLLGVSNTNTNSTDTPTNGSSTYSTNSSGEMQLFSQRQSNNSNLELDEEGKASRSHYRSLEVF